MRGVLTIGDRDRLVLGRYEVDNVVGPQFEASVVVGEEAARTALIHDDGRRLVGLLRFVWGHWNGWDGPASWRSADDRLRLTLNYRRLGRLELALSLVPDDSPERRVDLRTEMKAGFARLKAFADDAAIFFQLLAADPSDRFIAEHRVAHPAELNASLRAFYAEWTRLPPELSALREAMIRLFALLAAPEHRTDAACRYVSAYVNFCLDDEYSPFAERGDDEIELIPSEVRDIILDVGDNLNKAITKPAIAEDFDATPEQVLARVRALTF
jgi:hypothetical protein